MVDKDYTKKQTNDTIKLSGDLERKIGWLGHSKKINPDEAYHVVANAMKNNPNSVKTSEIGVVFNEALRKVDGDTSQIW